MRKILDVKVMNNGGLYLNIHVKNDDSFSEGKLQTFYYNSITFGSNTYSDYVRCIIQGNINVVSTGKGSIIRRTYNSVLKVQIGYNMKVKDFFK